MMSKHKEHRADVIIIGAGPAGLLSAILLGRKGHNVILVERHPEHYPLPRAVTFDDEAARILSSIGIDAENDDQIQFFEDWYELKNQNNEVLARYDWRGRTRAGWHRLYWFNQPELELKLATKLAELPNVKTMRGFEALQVEQSNETATVVCRDEATGDSTTFIGKFLVGADGANSLVRTQSGLTSHDLGFQFDWLVVDIKLKAPMHFEPEVFQFCDPSRPTTVVPAGPGRRRWEFMVLPGETPEMLNTPEAAWNLLERWGATPENSSLERHAVWCFKGRWAEQWTKGRVLIAGDAAHLMPPFAGQGLCAALRDAANLSWKLDLVLRGQAGDALLKTYSDERRDHVSAFISLSVDIGRVVCVTDPVEAAARDSAMIAEFEANGPQPAVDPNLSLGSGVWIDNNTHCGKLSAQGVVEINGEKGRFDDLIGRGWVALGWNVDPRDHLSKDQLSKAEILGFKFVKISDENHDGVLRDINGTYIQWFRESKSDIFIIRPDFYVATASKLSDFDKDFNDLYSYFDKNRVASI
jgi:3-(3-hydroxy-phenyl)propionate hydroxylase